jgi:uncharacterized integral membrane protein
MFCTYTLKAGSLNHKDATAIPIAKMIAPHISQTTLFLLLCLFYLTNTDVTSFNFLTL